MTVWSFGVLRGGPAAGPLVVKVGGSLLARPGWDEAVAGLLRSWPGPLLVVVGGGPVVDGLRAIDAAAPQPAAAMHWRAIEALGITARLVAEAVRLPLAESPAWVESAVLDVSSWLARGPALPEGWHVTSDSIAAAAAAAGSAGLVLAKSLPPPAPDLETLAAVGWVDPHFPQAAARLGHVGWAAPAIPTPARSRDGR